MPSLARRALAEIYGTFALVFFGCGAVVMDSFPGGRYGTFGISMVFGIVLAVAVTTTMPISGGHLNPAVTTGLLVARRISAADAFVYIVAQLAAACLAIVALKAIVPGSVGNLVSWGTPLMSSRITFGQAIALEAIMTFFLMGAVMGTAVAKNAHKVGGFAIGLTAFFGIMISAPLTGGALNPARAFGPAIMSGTMTGHAAYWIGPMLGAVLAAGLWGYVLLKDEADA
jgi:MIP family channel proteins